MDANALSLLSVFETKRRLEVPLFQRQYVWSEEHQWAPLWEDIERKFVERLNGRTEAPAHFLGAIVLDQKQTPITHVERRSIIDGQQRLTTIQIFLAALRDFCKENNCAELANECESFVLNTGRMAEPTTEKFKVWPTQRDREDFENVVTAGSRAAVEKQYPLKRRKYQRRPDPRPNLVEAYFFFYDQLRSFFLAANGELPLKADVALEDRLDAALQALRSSLLIVVIDLGSYDDAQVIFETLNARGAPLLPADLLRNYIFLRAARETKEQEELYQEFWSHFDDDFWRKEVKQGRLSRPRSDLFIQHFLASRLTTEIPIKHLFVEYKNWIERFKPFATIREELQTLKKQGEAFRRILEPQPGDPLHSLAKFLDDFEIGTAHPLLLILLDRELSNEQWAQISKILESYILRRAVCNLTTKNYNRVFLAIAKQVRDGGTPPETIEEALASYSGDSTEWPTDRAFQSAWKDGDAYHRLGGGRLVHVLKRLNATFLTNKMEEISIETPLTVEHLMPQKWIPHWPLADGREGVDEFDVFLEEDETLRAASEKRHAKVQTMGNLTILAHPLNAAVSNGDWTAKKKAIIESSVLPINVMLRTVERWNEEAIERRGDELLQRAMAIWPPPRSEFVRKS